MDPEALWQLRHQANAQVLCIKSESGELEGVRQLLAEGVSPDSVCSYGYPALLGAVRSERTAVVELLLGAGAGVDVPDSNGWTALTCAAVRGHLDIVRLLLRGGADPALKNKSGKDALAFAEERGNADMVELLLGAGLGVDVPDSDGKTPLMRAARKGNLDIVRLLLRSGADPALKNKSGEDALAFAGTADVATLLRSAVAVFASTPLQPGESIAAHARRCGLADQAILPGTRLQVGELGEGVYESFEKRTFGANRHHIHFASGLEKVELKKMQPALWSVVVEGTPEPAAAELAAAEPEPEPAAAGLEPAVVAEEAEPPELDAWLAQAGLGQYGPQLKEYGYDSLNVLQAATEADIVEMTEDPDIGMKKPHRRLFLTQWQALVVGPQQADQ
jgi:ankyrin repeat protein